MILVSLLLVFVGTMLIAIGLILASIRGKEAEKKVEGGAVIIIGPVPIVIGSNKKVTYTLMILAIILFVISVFAFLVLNWVIK